MVVYSTQGFTATEIFLLSFLLLNNSASKYSNSTVVDTSSFVKYQFYE